MTQYAAQEYKILEWDSSFFGFKVALISSLPHELSELLKKLTEEDVKLVYLFMPSKDQKANKIAEENGGTLVDEKIKFCKQIKKAELLPIDTDHIKSYIFHPLNEKLISLALQSGIYSRYRLDSHFPEGTFEKLYKEWIEKSLAKKIADEVFVYCEEKEQGLITISRKDGYVEIGLLAVDSLSRGKSIGRELMKAAFAKTSEWGYDTVKVATQKENAIACSFYEKAGFRVEKKESVYHFWL